MKTKSTHPEIPSPREMADELLMNSSQLILDHYSATQGRQVLKLMQSDPTALLTEMWRALRNLNLTMRAMAVEQGRKEPPDPELVRSLRPEAYQSIYPAVETPESDEMTRAQRRKLDDWLESLAHNPAEMTILFLHGKESKPGGTKPTYLAKQGFTVLNPKLPADDFDEAVRIAQAAFDEHAPAVVVGSSRGGAVAMNINSGDAEMVLLAPAWKKWGSAKAVKPKTIVIHSRQDEVIPFAESEALVASSPNTVLVEIGTDHQLSTPDPLDAMLDAVRRAASFALPAASHPELVAGSDAGNQMSLELLALGAAHGKDHILSPNEGNGQRFPAAATNEEPTTESIELAATKGLRRKSTQRKRRNVNLNNEATSLRFSAHTVLNVLVPEEDFRRLGLPDGSHVIITIDADSIPEDETRSQLLARASEFLLPRETRVIAKLRDSERIAKTDRDYGVEIKKKTPGLPATYHWNGVIPVEIVLLEDLLRSTRVHGGRRLHACRCHIPHLKVEARSLNHALSLIIRHFEPSRISSSGNVFKEIYAQVGPNNVWRLLDEIPAPPASTERCRP